MARQRKQYDDEGRPINPKPEYKGNTLNVTWTENLRKDVAAVQEHMDRAFGVGNSIGDAVNYGMRQAVLHLLREDIAEIQSEPVQRGLPVPTMDEVVNVAKDVEATTPAEAQTTTRPKRSKRK